MNRSFLISVLLVIIVFAVGIFVGSALKGADSTGIDKMLKNSELSTESFLVEQELFESFDTSCDLAEQRLATLSEDLWRLGKVLGEGDAEKRLGKDYDFLKRKFHLMQIRIYVLYKKLQQNCGIDTNVVLFYFDRSDESSTEQGLILDDLVEQYGLRVFAVEYNYSSDLSFLEEYYGVESAPFLVINYDNVIPHLATADEIIPVLYES
ncbi:hypothetical protein KY329_01590 [Candidatus Woesearchaeota archaeon]|nr:hypothetical protein [Candidatus Woesearchaeota archaeon]